MDAPTVDRERLIVEHRDLPSVVVGKLWKRYHLPARMLEDLIAEGAVGLVDAAGRYVPTRGASFRTYAFRRIAGTVIDCMRREPRFNRRLGLVAEEPVSLDSGATSEDDDVRTLADVLPGGPEPEAVLEPEWNRVWLSDQLDPFVSALPDREQIVIVLHYWWDMKLTDIGELFGVTESRACQLKTAAERRLRLAMAAA